MSSRSGQNPSRFDGLAVHSAWLRLSARTPKGIFVVALLKPGVPPALIPPLAPPAVAVIHISKLVGPLPALPAPAVPPAPPVPTVTVTPTDGVTAHHPEAYPPPEPPAAPPDMFAPEPPAPGPHTS